ncbi:putative tricarboxylic transport membrane protein [Chromohalobacter marismortui]|uniref:Putative tricarboxylic transport membrane protein n=1 Tax=Chromohalobacter marismortui TaxID=42055 RepID=A0A4R7NMS2_9GAMM|nr:MULTISPECIES: tripartite tricarboxylate transporter TctB family protein [Chromohalobacter]MCI0509996.1 tripartite tricarboxylate transporter TctB family protein [Chromohalobacter sp.]MCI0593285.1 tripartite tricarboxylate transporter TctB family protein [Chromohalobacter sp.]TDU22103.1 putative tricarboxylic transport membrane protein [Chromohalobacter marismortui]
MSCNDRISGCLLVIFGALVMWRASTFPTPAGLTYGPGLFPSIAATGLMLCGAAIGFGSRRRATPNATRRSTTRPLALLTVVAGYALLLDPLGFHITSFLAVAATCLLFGMRITGSVLLALPLVIGVHLLFYSLLHVPLPWGLLTPWAW